MTDRLDLVIFTLFELYYIHIVLLQSSENCRARTLLRPLNDHFQWWALKVAFMTVLNVPVLFVPVQVLFDKTCHSLLSDLTDVLFA